MLAKNTGATGATKPKERESFIMSSNNLQVQNGNDINTDDNGNPTLRHRKKWRKTLNRMGKDEHT